MAGKLKFNPRNNYNANYTFPTSFTAAGDIISNTTLTVVLSGSDIVQKGLKNTIRAKANELDLPQGYSCIVEED